MTTHRLCRVTEMPQKPVTTTVTAAAPLIVVAELRWLAATAGHGLLGVRSGHHRLTPGELRRCADQLDPPDGGDPR